MWWIITKSRIRFHCSFAFLSLDDWRISSSEIRPNSAESQLGLRWRRVRCRNNPSSDVSLPVEIKIIEISTKNIHRTIKNWMKILKISLKHWKIIDYPQVLKIKLFISILKLKLLVPHNINVITTSNIIRLTVIALVVIGRLLTWLNLNYPNLTK